MTKEIVKSGTTRKKYSAAIPWNERNLRFKLAGVIGVAWTIYIILSLFNVFFYLGIVIFPITHRAICSGAITCLALLIVPWKKGKELGALSLIDILLVLMAAIGAGYIALNASTLVYEWKDATVTQMCLGFAFGLAILETARRVAGWIPVGLIVASFFYFVYSDYFPGFMMSSGYSYPRAVAWMYLSGEGMWGSILGTVTSVVPGFILFGSVLRICGADDFFGDLALACMGKYRGGPAKTAVFSSMLFGSLSGSPAANVATTGQITIPMMKQNGFKPELAGAVEAVASTGGPFTPPIMGSVSFLIADALGVNYWTVCASAFLPVVVYYGILLFQIDSEAIRNGFHGLPEDKLPQAWSVLKRGWYYLVPLGVLIFTLGVLKYSAQTSILYTIIALIICSFFSERTRLTPKRIREILDDTAAGMIMVIPLCTGIGILVGALNISGLGNGLAGELADIAGNSRFMLLAMTAIAIFIMGMGMTALACYLLAVALLVPALIAAGVLPIAAHMFLFYYGTLSFITPPVAIAAFVAAAIADADATRTGLVATRLGISAFFLPWFFVTNPGILWVGSAFNIAFDFVGIFVSLMLLSSAFTGIMFAPVNKFMRVVFAVLGGLFVVPFPTEFNYVLVPISICVVVIFYLRGRKSPSSESKEKSAPAA